MTKKKTRTKIKDRRAEVKDVTKEEAKRVKGGSVNMDNGQLTIKITPGQATSK